MEVWLRLGALVERHVWNELQRGGGRGVVCGIYQELYFSSLINGHNNYLFMEAWSDQG